MDELQKEVKDRLESNIPIEIIEQELIGKGFLEEDISNAILGASGSLSSSKQLEDKAKIKKFFFKELFDRAGYGFGSEQYINILFSQSGASYFLIALVNGIKSFLSGMLSSFIKQYSMEYGVNRNLTWRGGLIFGFCFILMAAARFFKMPWLFVVAILLGLIGVVSYGEMYLLLLRLSLNDQRRGLIGLIYRHGLLITIFALIIGAHLMDNYNDTKINIAGIKVGITGYLVVFELAAICFIFSSYILSFIKVKSDKPKINLRNYCSKYLKRVREDLSILVENKIIFMLVFASTITSLVQVLGNSFYGIFIYDIFGHIGFGGYMNVAMVFLLAVISSLATPIITRNSAKAYGKLPMMIFGTMLMAIMPLTFYFNPNLVSIGMGVIVGVLGAAIVGIADGLLGMELMNRKMRESYFRSYSVLSFVPYIILLPISAYVVEVFKLRKLFLLLGLILIVIVAPTYFLIMLVHERNSS